MDNSNAAKQTFGVVIFVYYFLYHAGEHTQANKNIKFLHSSRKSSSKNNVKIETFFDFAANN
jgi:hypothetical protein